jgi:hypothetical protein
MVLTIGIESRVSVRAYADACEHCRAVLDDKHQCLDGGLPFGQAGFFWQVCDVITGVAQGGPVLAGSDPRNEERMPQAVCSVIAASVERLGRSVPEMDTVAIEFDLVNPASAGLHLLDRGRQCRLDESREGRSILITMKPLAGSGAPMVALTSRCLACNEPMKQGRRALQTVCHVFRSVRYVSVSYFRRAAGASGGWER